MVNSDEIEVAMIAFDEATIKALSDSGFHAVDSEFQVQDS